jgi:tRNA G18 (ribose-2'-O)-methylase SpoU
MPTTSEARFATPPPFGARVVLNDTCCDPLYRKSIRTSMGSVLCTPYARMRNWPHGLTTLKNEGFTLVALTPREARSSSPRASGDSRISDWRCSLAAKAPGCRQKPKPWRTCCVRIPIRDAVDSLNVATAAAIALHYFTVIP